MTKLWCLRRIDTLTALGIAVEIDDFKQVNDTYGHQQGDLVLMEVARAVRELSRDVDKPARYGGEEMAVVLPQTDIEGTALAEEPPGERPDGGAPPRPVASEAGAAAARTGAGLAGVGVRGARAPRGATGARRRGPSASLRRGGAV